MGIHNYEAEYARAQEQVTESQLSLKNKQLIFSFVNDLLLEGLSLPRLIKYLRLLRLIGISINKDFDTVSKDDLKQFISSIQQKITYSPWTIRGYKEIVRRFYRWMEKTQGYACIIDWISLKVSKSQKKLPSQTELFTEEDVQTLLKYAEHPRDKAFVSMLWESGACIGEIGNLCLENITVDKYGILLAMQGKTGSRKIRLISSTPYVITWINTHPWKENPKAPLWINVGTIKHNQAMKYDNMWILLRNLSHKSGIRKKFNPHIFRHSRATFMAHHLTEFQMNHYFGWTQGSDMPSTYVHMSGRDVDNAILTMNGVVIKENKEAQKFSPHICGRCETINAHDSKFCNKCSGILDPKYAMELQEQDKKEKKR
ncbi:tyrosine-type recombinase/integrase [Candidatus Woesearchaeota archaeon]|nr:tyrosine-type recombinase/integrase [Candidatus Woesearchaeota archaeon]